RHGQRTARALSGISTIPAGRQEMDRGKRKWDPQKCPAAAGDRKGFRPAPPPERAPGGGGSGSSHAGAGCSDAKAVKVMNALFSGIHWATCRRSVEILS